MPAHTEATIIHRMYTSTSPDHLFFELSSPFNAFAKQPTSKTEGSSDGSWSYCLPVAASLYADFDGQFSSSNQSYYATDTQQGSVCPTELYQQAGPVFPLSDQKVALTALLETEARRQRIQEEFEEDDSEEDSQWSPELPTVFESDDDEEDEWLEGFVEFRPNPALLSSHRRGGSEEDADVGLREEVLIKNFLRELHRVKREQKAQEKMMQGLSAADFGAQDSIMVQ